MDNLPSGSHSKIVRLDQPLDRQKNHVVIAMVAQDQMQTDTAMCLAAMCLQLKAGGLLSVKSSIIPTGRNMAVDGARKLGAEWILFLDSDVTFPSATLTHLLSRGKDIVGATYPKRVPPHNLLYRLLPQDDRIEVADGVVEVMGLPGGCLLVNMKVFDKLTKPYFQTPGFSIGQEIPKALQEYVTPADVPEIMGEDYFFCAMARAAGFKIWLDVNLTEQIGHIGQQIWFPQTYAEQEPHGKPSAGVPKVVQH